MKHIRILWLSYYYLPHVGGGTWSAYRLSKELSSRGHSIQLIVPNVKHSLSISKDSAEKLSRNNSASVHSTPFLLFPKKLGPLFSIFYVFFAALNYGKHVDVILSQFHPHHLLCPIAVLLGKILRKPVIFRANDVYHEMGLGFIVKFINTFNERFIKYAKAFLVVCSEHKEFLLSRFKDNSLGVPVSINYNGVDLSECRNAPKKDDAKKILGFPKNIKVILFVGRFSGPEYGIEVILKALPTIIKRIPEAHLLLVGDMLSDNLSSIIKSLNIKNNLKVYKPKSPKEILSFIMSADLCLGPFTATHAIPLKILEYLACGKPIVTGVKSLSVDLLSEESSFLFASLNPKSVADIMLKVLNDDKYAKRLGLKGKKRVEKFDWNKIADDLERILFSVVK